METKRDDTWKSRANRRNRWPQQICAFYFDIFQKILNNNFEEILLKSIQKSLENHEFLHVSNMLYVMQYAICYFIAQSRLA